MYPSVKCFFLQMYLSMFYHFDYDGCIQFFKKICKLQKVSSIDAFLLVNDLQFFKFRMYFKIILF